MNKEAVKYATKRAIAPRLWIGVIIVVVVVGALGYAKQSGNWPASTAVTERGGRE